MQIGIIALTLLFALGAVGLGLFAVRSSRMLFPEGYLFTVEGGFVSATHLPTGVSHSFEVGSDGSIAPAARTPRIVDGFDHALRAKAASWACLIANQPKDPRQAKESR